MGKRYIITYRSVDDKFWYEYQTNWFIVMVIKAVHIIMKYDIVNIMYRR